MSTVGCRESFLSCRALTSKKGRHQQGNLSSHMGRHWPGLCFSRGRTRSVFEKTRNPNIYRMKTQLSLDYRLKNVHSIANLVLSKLRVIAAVVGSTCPVRLHPGQLHLYYIVDLIPPLILSRYFRGGLQHANCHPTSHSSFSLLSTMGKLCAFCASMCVHTV